MTTFPYTYFENKLVPTQNAVLPVMTNSIQYGTGVIGGVRGYYDQKKRAIHLFRLTDHLQRFLGSIQLIGVNIQQDLETLKKIATTMIAKNKPHTDIYIRPYAYAPSHSIQPNFARDHEFKVCMYMFGLGEYLPLSKGLSVTISPWRRISDNAVPSRGKLAGGYICSAMATGEAIKNGFDEAILLNEQGHVAEGAAENIFLVRDGILITPAKSEEILEGITRKTMLQLAKDLRIPTEERAIDRTELYISDEAFFTGTGAQISWISAIDRRAIGKGKKGPITNKLQQLFFSLVRGNEKKYNNWLTTIKI